MQIVSFCCNWCSYAGADLAGSSRLEYPAEVKIIRIPCSCRVDPLFILRAFQRGADGVMVNGCHPGDCHYSTGNYYTRRRMALLFSMLDFLGIDKERIRLEWVSASEGARFAAVMNEFVGKLYELSPPAQAQQGFESFSQKATLCPAGTVGAVSNRPPSISRAINNRPYEIAHNLLSSGEVNAVLAWKKGLFPYDTAPALFTTPESLQDMTYDGFCGSNLSKYLVETNATPGKTLIFLKPCDTYSLNQLLSEHRVNRDDLHIVGIGCNGMLDIEKLRAMGLKGIQSIEEHGENLTIHTTQGSQTCSRASALLDKCLSCKGKDHMVYDELINTEASADTAAGDKYAAVTELENMSSRERFAYWRGQLSKCIRCNACRNTCPACTCISCVFDNPKSGVSAKVNATPFEEDMFHIIRAYHVAGRCSDCGECSRVCPQGVPIHLLNRKFIKDINEFFGEYQAGATPEQDSPLLHFDYNDPEPNALPRKGGKK